MKLKGSFRLHRIRIKLLAMVLMVFAVFCILLMLFSAPSLFKALSFQVYLNSREMSGKINNLSENSDSYISDLEQIASDSNAFFEIIDRDGNLAYSSVDNSSGKMPAYYAMVPSEYKYFSSEYDNYEMKNKPGLNIKYLIYTAPMGDGKILHIYNPVADVETIVDVAGNVYTALSLPILIIMTGSFCLIVTRFTQPLVEMNDVTKDMAALNFERKCADYGKDEIGELGKSINILSNTLDYTLMDLKDKNEQLEKDIERRYALDNAKRTFIANVSHELKTPIAIISGYAEGLCEGISSDPETVKEYYNIIYDESKKMNSLVVQLLELSKVDADLQVFTPETFDIGQKIISLLSHLSLQLESNEITVINNVPEHLNVYGQSEKIEIVIKNYVTNAIFHCSGEKIIILNYEKLQNSYRFTVFNTGNHIEDCDMEGIWDSFYRADKSHDRSENRFGIGLSIVKGIMKNHRCGYGVKNVENGVEFTFEVAEDSEYYEKNEI